MVGWMVHLKLKYECLQFRAEQNTTEKPNTPKRYNLIANSKSKELIAVEVDSGRSAIFKA